MFIGCINTKPGFWLLLFIGCFRKGNFPKEKNFSKTTNTTSLKETRLFNVEVIAFKWGSETTCVVYKTIVAINVSSFYKSLPN